MTDRHAPRGRVRLALLVAATAATLMVTGCSMLPDEGPVVAGGRAAEPLDTQQFDYNPPGPRPGAQPDEIVSGFLSAQQAVPVSTRVAEEYLTEDAAASWRPDRGTIVYTTQRVVAQDTGVVVRLEGTSVLDASGRWRGEWSGDGSGALRIRVEQEGKEWRIVDPPPALTIPRSHFESRYEPFSVYFFDPTGSVLVPEPVYLPVGVQAATRLMAGLLEGPPRGSRDVERSYLPPGTDLGVGVPVRGGGIAEVPLSQQMADLRPGDLSRALAQISFTLRQLPEVAGIRVLVDGAPLSMPGEGEEVLASDTGQEYAPTLDWASSELFGLRGRRIVRVGGNSESTVAALPRRFVDEAGVPRSLGVSIAADRSAVVSGDGRQVWVVTSREGARVDPRRAWAGTDVLRPMWDRTDRLWLVDRTANGSTVTVVADDDTRRIDAAGLEDERVEAAALSRDGTRLVVVARREGEPAQVRLFRVVRDSWGGPVRLTRPRVLPTTSPLRRPRGLGWWSPTSVAVMTRPSAFSTRVQLLPSDQSSAGGSGSDRLDLLFEAGQTMAASPGGPKTLLVATAEGEAHELGADGRWAEVDLPDLRAHTFVG